MVSGPPLEEGAEGNSLNRLDRRLDLLAAPLLAEGVTATSLDPTGVVHRDGGGDGEAQERDMCLLQDEPCQVIFLRWREASRSELLPASAGLGGHLLPLLPPARVVLRPGCRGPGGPAFAAGGVQKSCPSCRRRCRAGRRSRC